MQETLTFVGCPTHKTGVVDTAVGLTYKENPSPRGIQDDSIRTKRLNIKIKSKGVVITSLAQRKIKGV
jgi:hypothetical protein